jgi:hypothetical protein
MFKKLTEHSIRKKLLTVLYVKIYNAKIFFYYYYIYLRKKLFHHASL